MEDPIALGLVYDPVTGCYYEADDDWFAWITYICFIDFCNILFSNIFGIIIIIAFLNVSDVIKTHYT